MEPIEAKPALMRRIVTFPLTLLVIETALFVALAMLASQAARGLFVRQTPGQTLGALLIAVVLVAAWKSCKAWIERETDRELELAAAARELGLGLLAGFLLFSAMTAIVALLGGFRVEGVRGIGQLWGLLAMAIVSGSFEEILFRGVLLRHLEAMLGSWLALALTAALFGAAHLGNPAATWFSSLAIALEAGILLGAAYMLTRRLWLAIGIHAAWNFTQGWVFSVPVSGGDVPLGLLITRREGPDWLTGGDFGLEASAVAMVVATLAGVLMLRRTIVRGELRAPMWARSGALQTKE